MKKNLLALGLLAASYSVQAQNVLLHVDTGANMYVSNGTLVYNGGGLQTRTTGKIENRGNIMVVGSTGDVFRTLDATTGNKLDGGNIVMKLTDPANPVTSPYGQLYITGINQADITGVVDKEYAATEHGSYQQIGIPFVGKTFSSLSAELGGNFNNQRWQGREILKWSNANLRFDGSIIPPSPITSASTPGITIDLASSTTTADRTAYYTLGSADLNPTLAHTIKGTPFADGINGANRISLTPSNVPSTFGTGGNNRNIYQEKYNTYYYDAFDNASPWNVSGTTFGQYYYQFSNPYLTNIDLSMIGFTESGVTTDNNAFDNIWGIIVNPQNVTYNSTTGGSATYAASQFVTFDPTSHKPTGNFDALVVKPLGTFKIKLRTSTPQQMDFDNLRRFSNIPRAEGTSYNVTAAKNTTTTGTIKQLGVLALDANGNQIGETYYVVAPQFTTGNIPNASASSVQAMTNTSAIIQTYEETPNGGIDQNYSSTYRLYINEANESNYLGKRIDLGIFGQNVSSLKFQLRDDANLVPDNTHLLSAGKGFYYKAANGQAVQIKQGDIIPVTNSNYGLYYGEPNSTLDTDDIITKSRTLITYNPSINNYIVRFDPALKSASIEVFDASGKLVISEKSVKTDSDYVIKLDSSMKAMYIVKVVGNDGTIVNSKILIK